MKGLPSGPFTLPVTVAPKIGGVRETAKVRENSSFSTKRIVLLAARFASRGFSEYTTRTRLRQVSAEGARFSGSFNRYAVAEIMQLPSEQARSWCCGRLPGCGQELRVRREAKCRAVLCLGNTWRASHISMW